MSHHTPTDAELRWQYRRTDWADQGISLETALATPALRAALALGAAMRHRRRARSAAPIAAAGFALAWLRSLFM